MPNEFIKPSVVAREALMVLENNLIMANLIHRDYSSEFVAGVGDTVTIRKPAKFVAHNFTGNIIVQDATEGKEAVKLDHFRDVSFKVTSKEMTLDIRDFSKQLIEPAMMAVAQGVDEDILNVVAEVNNAVTCPRCLMPALAIRCVTQNLAASIPWTRIWTRTRRILWPMHQAR